MKMHKSDPKHDSSEIMVCTQSDLTHFVIISIMLTNMTHPMLHGNAIY